MPLSSGLLLTLINLLCFTYCTQLPADPQVTTTKGVVEGLYVNHSSTTGALYQAFLGIPYGEKPIRFQLAQPKQRWSGVLRAQKDGPACPQPTRLPSNEDCLFLNVFTPLGTTSSSKLPVMVYLHGSAFSYSSSYSKHYGPDFLTPHGVILVTLTYRLGVLGFLTLGSREAPGNMGLHDSQLALRWVRREILAFGGDPDNVTLFGQSAGASLALYHYISHPSTDEELLFRRVIAQSGSLAGWSHVTAAEGQRRARVLGEAVGCDEGGDDSALLACLTELDINTLVKHTYIPLDLLTAPPGLDFPFVPVMDYASWSDSPFFNGDLDCLVDKARHRHLPLITGFTTDEGILFIDRSEKWRKAVSALFSFTPQDNQGGLSEEAREFLSTMIKNHYFPYQSSGSDGGYRNLKSLIALYTDSQFAFPAIQLAHIFREDTYLYVFAHDGSWRIPNTYFSQFHISGVSHGDDLPYLFAGKSDQKFQKTEENSNNLKVKDYLSKLWTDFAKNGVPTSEWKTVSEGHYLHIDATPATRSLETLEDKYYNFWSSLAKQTQHQCPLHSNVTPHEN